jgi:hypothetical protein
LSCLPFFLSALLLFPLDRDASSEEPASDFDMAIESAPTIPGDAAAFKAEVHDNVDLVDDPSREVSKKRQSLSDLFTIVSEPLFTLSKMSHKEPLLINGLPRYYSLPAASL